MALLDHLCQCHVSCPGANALPLLPCYPRTWLLKLIWWCYPKPRTRQECTFWSCCVWLLPPHASLAVQKKTAAQSPQFCTALSLCSTLTTWRPFTGLSLAWWTAHEGFTSPMNSTAFARDNDNPSCKAAPYVNSCHFLSFMLLF